MISSSRAALALIRDAFHVFYPPPRWGATASAALASDSHGKDQQTFARDTLPRGPPPRSGSPARMAPVSLAATDCRTRWRGQSDPGTCLDNDCSRQVGGDVRSSPGDRNDGPGDQCQRQGKHHRAEPAYRQVGRQEWQGQEPVEPKPGNDRKPQCKRRPNDDLSAICRVIHGGTVSQFLVPVTL
jgi:hypothetical protein